MIWGALLKYCASRSEGGGGAIKARQNACVVSRRVVLRVWDAMTGGCLSANGIPVNQTEVGVLTLLSL